jgi:hypothetical protein
MYVLGCGLSLIRLYVSDFGITAVDDIIIIIIIRVQNAFFIIMYTNNLPLDDCLKFSSFCEEFAN